MNRRQIAQAARDAQDCPTETDEYYQLWDAAAGNEIGLYVELDPATAAWTIHGLLEIQKQVEWIKSMILVEPPDMPGVIYLMHRPLETIDETEPE